MLAPRALVFLGIAGLIVVAVFALHDVHLHGGPLRDSGNGFSAQAVAGAPFSAGLFELRNGSGHEIEIDRVSLGAHSRGLRLAGVLAYGPCCSLFSAAPGFPPNRWPLGKRPKHLPPAADVVLRAHAARPILFGFRAARPGRYVLHGFDVRYHVKYMHGLRLPYRRHETTTMTVCVRARGAPIPTCTSPPSN